VRSWFEFFENTGPVSPFWSVTILPTLLGGSPRFGKWEENEDPSCTLPPSLVQSPPCRSFLFFNSSFSLVTFAEAIRYSPLYHTIFFPRPRFHLAGLPSMALKVPSADAHGLSFIPSWVPARRNTPANGKKKGSTAPLRPDCGGSRSHPHIRLPENPLQRLATLSSSSNPPHVSFYPPPRTCNASLDGPGSGFCAFEIWFCPLLLV